MFARFLVSVLAIASIRAAEMFPFVLPWDDASPSVTNLSAWLERPAGRDGFVTVKNGHLFANGKRLRIFGVNVAFGANFPTHEDAEKIAARMAKFGINCVRFHHMDMQPAPGGIWAKEMRTLDAGQLDKLDYFIAELKKNGIYADLNLHVSRTYPDRPREEKKGNPSFDKGVDNYCAAMIVLQKDYARDLLTHVNPYTKNAYIAEPAVALIEINNENALLDEWHNGGLETIAAPYRDELSALWMEWLREKYSTDEALAAAWREGAREAGPELLVAATPSSQGSPGVPRRADWSFEQHESAKVHGEVKDGAITFTVEATSSEPWHAQFYTPVPPIVPGEKYVAAFRARAPSAMTASVSFIQNHAPWKVLGSQRVELTPEWREIRVMLKPSAADDRARFCVTGLGMTPGKFEFTSFSLRTAALDGSPQRAAFTRNDYASRTPAAQRDWFSFLWSIEEKYWTGMYAYLREELKARSLIVGTQLGWSPFPIQAKMDVIDSHAYWQHPHFTKRMWDMENWTVKNIPMAGREDGGTLPGLALQRVAGKPYLCTEYNHSAPNEFAGETFPLVCAYAALQDWDGVFAFAYSHRGNDWDKRYFPSFFDIDQHPVKMATLPASLAMFLRGDVARAGGLASVVITPDEAMERTRMSGPRLGAQQFGIDGLTAFVHRVGVQGGGRGVEAFSKVVGGQTSSDTGELVWNSEKRVVTVNTARSKGFIGEAGGREMKFDNVTIAPGAAWGGVVATVMDGADFTSARRIFITAFGKSANSEMQWTSDAHESVGKNWGRAPSLVEGIAATLTLPVSDKKMKAWALDERGQRRDEIPVKDGVLGIDPRHRTLWYEVARE
jgi:hypothetical protein